MLSAVPDVIGNATAQAGELRSLLAGEGRVGNPSQSTPEALRERSVAAERLEAAAVSQEVELTPWQRDAGVAMLTGQVGCIKGGRSAGVTTLQRVLQVVIEGEAEHD